MTNSSSFFTPVLDGGRGDHPFSGPTPFDEVSNWTVSLLFRLADAAELHINEDRRFRMLRCLVGLSPMLTISKDALALTLATVGTRDQAVDRSIEFAWSALEEGTIISAQLVAINAISHETVDDCLSTESPLVYDTQTDRGLAHESALNQVRELTNASELLEAHKQVQGREVTVDEDRSLQGSEIGSPELGEGHSSWPEPRCSFAQTLDVSLFPRFTERLSKLLNLKCDTLEAMKQAQAVLNLVNAEVIGLDGIVNQKSASIILGVTKQRAHQIFRGESAPSPIAYLDNHPLWLRAQIEALRDERK